jgi:sucrose-6-phosphate hydrolase SacC (GH32 family)
MLSRREFLKLGGFGLSAFLPINTKINGNTPSNYYAREWAPLGIGLKDHTIFYTSGYYYLASNNLQKDHWEDRFVYARSENLLDWEYLGSILTERHPGWWDEAAIWAPHVVEENNTCHMYYTGVTSGITQSILHATSTDPTQLDSWNIEPQVFQPSHENMIWEGSNQWSDCRDPAILKVMDTYYLYYTGLDSTGGIVGLATSNSIYGPWTDTGAIYIEPNTILESPFVFEHDNNYFLTTNNVKLRRAQIHISETPIGPWSAPLIIFPGWAHEFFEVDGAIFTSYLTSYSITIDNLCWPRRTAPFPTIGDQKPIFLPIWSR